MSKIIVQIDKDELFYYLFNTEVLVKRLKHAGIPAIYNTTLDVEHGILTVEDSSVNDSTSYVWRDKL